MLELLVPTFPWENSSIFVTSILFEFLIKSHVIWEFLMLKNKGWQHKPYGLSFPNWEETQESRRCRANTTKRQVLWEEGRYSQSPGLLSMHPYAFCEYPNSLLNFHKHFLSQLMSFFFFLTHLEHSRPILWITFSCFRIKIPFFLWVLSPSQILEVTQIYPALLFLRTIPFSDPFTLSSHPSPALAIDFLFRAIFHKKQSFVTS